ncbi:ZBT26 protein, partial [Ramphastos sulfuratus]|nr:ZBT26 protein [Ramphastos sulfuratus]
MSSCAEVLRFQLPGHEAAALRSMNRLRAEERFCDVTIVARSLRFRGHRVILAACSPFLRDQFLLNPAAELRVSLAHSARVLADLLLSCYTGALEFAGRDLVNYLTAASYLQMEHVVERCRGALARFIHATPSPGPALRPPASAGHPAGGHGAGSGGAGHSLQPLVAGAKVEEEEEEEEEEDVGGDVCIVKGEGLLLFPGAATTTTTAAAGTAMGTILGTAMPANDDPGGDSVGSTTSLPTSPAAAAAAAAARCATPSALTAPPLTAPSASSSSSSAASSSSSSTAATSSSLASSARCGKCGDAFQGVEKLVFHMRAQHLVFMCPRCGKQFNHSSNLNRHMNVHRGVKSHGCGVCGKSFTQKSTLHDHMNLHSGERPYRCSYCDVRFAHKPAIRRHLKEQHGKTTAENVLEASVAEINVLVR